MRWGLNRGLYGDPDPTRPLPERGRNSPAGNPAGDLKSTRRSIQGLREVGARSIRLSPEPARTSSSPARRHAGNPHRADGASTGRIPRRPPASALAGPAAGAGRMHALLRPPRQGGNAGSRAPSVAVRGNADGYTDRENAPGWSAMRPWTPQHAGSRRPAMTHRGTKKKRPASREIPASGAFSQVVAGARFELAQAEPTVLQPARSIRVTPC
jgi:hypothetical protein